MKPRLSFFKGGQGDLATVDGLNKVLDGNGFSAKTKGLKAYAHKGVSHPHIARAVAAVADVPSADRKGLALYLANRELNGSDVPSYRRFNSRAAGNIGGFFRDMYSDPAGIRHVYSKVRRGTLDRWNAAAAAVDAAWVEYSDYVR